MEGDAQKSRLTSRQDTGRRGGPARGVPESLPETDRQGAYRRGGRRDAKDPGSASDIVLGVSDLDEYDNQPTLREHPRHTLKHGLRRRRS